MFSVEESIDEGNETEVTKDPSCDDLLCVFEDGHEDMLKLWKGDNIWNMSVHPSQKEIKYYVMEINI